MDTSMSAGRPGSQGYQVAIEDQVAIEVQGNNVFHAELAKLKKYLKLYRLITYHAVPSHPYGYIHNGMTYPSYPNRPQYCINLHKLPPGSGHMLWEYLSFGAFTRLRGYHSERTQEWYFKDIFHLHNLANQFDMENLKSESAKEIFRKAQEMGLMEIINLLEELNYQSDLFPSLSVYLEKRLVGSALDYCQGGSQRAFAELQAQPSLSVAQILLKALIEISESGCKLGEQNSMSGEVYKRKLAETTTASDILGWNELKVPDTRWVNPKGEMTGVRKSGGSQFFGAAAKQATRREKGNSPEPPFERAAAREPTFDIPATLAYSHPLPFFSASSVRSDIPVPPRPSRDTSTTSSRGSIPYTRWIQMDWEAMGPPEQKIHRQRMPHAAYQNLPQTERAVSSERPAPGPSTTSGENLLESGADRNDDTEDEAAEACDRPVTPTGSEGNVPENTMTSFDTPGRSSRSSSHTLGGSPIQAEGPMDWDAEYDHDSQTQSLRFG
ncbi:hypothetical protein FCOIX_11474 [Fusarium coicis]|nr:hypothetical protein FCOIX_11474 [Fusarium coicis]